MDFYHLGSNSFKPVDKFLWREGEKLISARKSNPVAMREPRAH